VNVLLNDLSHAKIADGPGCRPDRLRCRVFHEVPLVPMTSVTLYTLMTVSFDWLACLGAATLNWPTSG
jgi:hypothetical protein